MNQHRQKEQKLDRKDRQIILPQVTAGHLVAQDQIEYPREDQQSDSRPRDRIESNSSAVEQFQSQSGLQLVHRGSKDDEKKSNAAEPKRERKKMKQEA